MKSTSIILLTRSGVIAIMGCVLMSCATVEDTIYMQGLDVSGPLNLPPLHTNNDSIASKISISPHWNIVNGDPIQGAVEYNQYSLPGNNLNWKYPVSTFGIDLDARVSSLVALSFGLNYASMGQEGLAGGSAGIGFMFRGDDAMGRFELGGQIQSMKYDASSVVKQTVTSWFSSSPTTTIAYFHDIGTSSPFGYYGSLILQSRNLTRVFDIFGQLGVSRQGLTSFTPHTEVAFLGVITSINTDTQTSNSATFFTLTPGCTFNLGNNSRLLAAVRIMKELEISGDQNNFLYQPVVQFDIGL